MVALEERAVVHGAEVVSEALLEGSCNAKGPLDLEELMEGPATKTLPFWAESLGSSSLLEWGLSMAAALQMASEVQFASGRLD